MLVDLPKIEEDASEAHRILVGLKREHLQFGIVAEGHGVAQCVVRQRSEASRPGSTRQALRLNARKLTIEKCAIWRQPFEPYNGTACYRTLTIGGRAEVQSAL